ncbi:MAG: hypothetical protein A4E55_01927 [Pelotomaculum sp. PtaU1.Bin035]|nr:MAG: hypothetical protein A4E55_01927 [Pelotomaculum sp. PtaU1.Bin035]
MELFFAVPVDVEEYVLEVQQMPGQPLLPVLVFPEAPAGRPAAIAVVEDGGHDGRQPEALALPLLLRGVVVDVPPDLDHVLQQSEWHRLVDCRLQFQQHVEYHVVAPEAQPVHDVGLLVAEVLQDVGLVDQRQVVFVYLPNPALPDEGLQQFQEVLFVGQQLPVSLVVGVMERSLHRFPSVRQFCLLPYRYYIMGTVGVTGCVA